MASPITIIPNTRMTVLLEKPEKASEKVQTPVIANARHAMTLVKAEGIHSVKNSITHAMSIIRAVS